MRRVDIIAVPLNDHEFWMECTICGPLGTVTQTDLDHTAVTHLRDDHAVDTTIEHNEI